jgi:hypothetical protein
MTNVQRDGRGAWVWLSDEELTVVHTALMESANTERRLSFNGHDEQVRVVEGLIARVLGAVPA